MQDLTNTLRRIASETGMTQKELAAKLGVSQPTISRAYRGLPIRGGPAYRRIVERLSEVELGIQSNSSIHDWVGWPAVAQTWPAPKSPKEAKALDNLVRALNEYVGVRSEGTS